MKLILFSILLLCVIHCNTLPNGDYRTFHRFIRAAKECRYEKGPWDECDPNTGTQKRTLKLKTMRSSESVCEPVMYRQRSCKKSCRYTRGVWGHCNNGLRYRVDILKNTDSSCESVRNITKTCKEQCRYSKSEWTQCENGIKTKTLTLIIDERNTGSGCEMTKLITKECQRQKAKQNKQRARKNNVAPSSFN